MKKFTSKMKHPQPGHAEPHGFTLGREGDEFNAFKDAPSRGTEKGNFPSPKLGSMTVGSGKGNPPKTSGLEKDSEMYLLKVMKQNARNK